MSEPKTAIVYDSVRQDEWPGFPTEVSRVLTEQGIEHRIVGVNGLKIDSEYRIELAPPYEVWRDESIAAYRVTQGPIT